MSFDYTLFVEPSHRQQKVCEASLYGRMKMKLRLLENQRGVTLGQQTSNDDRKSLADSDSNVGQVVRSGGVRKADGQLVPELAHVLALNGVSHAKVMQPIGNGFTEWTSSENLLRFVTLECVARHVLDNRISMEIQKGGRMFTADADMGRIGGHRKWIGGLGLGTEGTEVSDGSAKEIVDISSGGGEGFGEWARYFEG